MNEVRYGIIGIGNMGSNHVKALVEGRVENGVLAAVCDINPARLQWAKEQKTDVAVFDTAESFFENADVDALHRRFFLRFLSAGG